MRVTDDFSVFDSERRSMFGGEDDEGMYIYKRRLEIHCLLKASTFLPTHYQITHNSESLEPFTHILYLCILH